MHPLQIESNKRLAEGLGELFVLIKELDKFAWEYMTRRDLCSKDEYEEMYEDRFQNLHERLYWIERHYDAHTDKASREGLTFLKIMVDLRGKLMDFLYLPCYVRGVKVIQKILTRKFILPENREPMEKAFYYATFAHPRPSITFQEYLGNK